MMKNSEWGAVAYLGFSNNGSGIEPYINNYSGSVAGLTGIGASTATTSNMDNMKEYNEEGGGAGSTTGNVYGIYDLNGCRWERTAGAVLSSRLEYAEYQLGTKYGTLYPTREFNSLNITKNFGDAIREIALQSGKGAGWNGDYSNFPTENEYPTFTRGGNYDEKTATGIFSFSRAYTQPICPDSFRVVLVPILDI